VGEGVKRVRGKKEGKLFDFNSTKLTHLLKSSHDDSTFTRITQTIPLKQTAWKTQEKFNPNTSMNDLHQDSIFLESEVSVMVS